VKRYFEIKNYIQGKKAKIYTIYENGESLSETDKFFMRFKDVPKFKKDIEIIVKWIRKISNEGVLERHFRPEDEGVAIPIETSKLRLYGYRINDQILVLGNGGEKSSNLVKDSPDAFPHFQLINSLAFIVDLNKSKKKLIVSQDQLIGDLTFFITTH